MWGRDLISLPELLFFLSFIFVLTFQLQRPRRLSASRKARTKITLCVGGCRIAPPESVHVWFWNNWSLVELNQLYRQRGRPQPSRQSTQQRSTYTGWEGAGAKKRPFWFFFPPDEEIFFRSVLWQADRWAVFTSVPLTGWIVMLCRCCNDIPPQCNHSAWHINFNAAQARIHHFCSVLSDSRYMWTYITLIIEVTLAPERGQ